MDEKKGWNRHMKVFIWCSLRKIEWRKGMSKKAAGTRPPKKIKKQEK